MWVRKGNLLVNMDNVPVACVTGTAIRFQKEAGNNASYTKIEFSSFAEADNAFKRIMDLLNTDEILEFDYANSSE